ncbi:hypothetical protein LJC55_00310 [Eubacteriales bacterium OttesenSCG-928-N14]|nr:hypothetical protein [Eubacteriales bacterium OttesenSCG-928-N14]
MKIPITLTILNGMPDVTWQNVSLFLRDDGIEYTPIQSNAAYCWRYFLALYNYGFTAFLGLYNKANKEELYEAFSVLGIREMLEYLISMAQNGRWVDDELEAWLEEHAHAWSMAVQDYVLDNADEFFEIIDEDYTMVPHRLFVPLGAIMAAVVLGFMTIIALTQTIVIYSLFFLIFFVIASPFIALLLYGLFWRVSIKKDVLTICRPLRRKRTLRIDEITAVKRKRDRLIIYARGKKVLTVRREVGYYSMLLTQLDLAGKIDQDNLNDITVQQQKSSIITAFMWPAAAAVFLLQSLLRKVNPAGIYEIALLSALVLVALLYALLRPWRRIIANEDSLTIVKMLGNEKVYPVSSITKVNIHSDNMTIYAYDKKIAKINFRCEGSSSFLQRLKSEDPPIEFEQ